MIVSVAPVSAPVAAKLAAVAAPEAVSVPVDTSPTVVKFPALAVLLMVSVLPVIPVAELSRPTLAAPLMLSELPDTAPVDDSAAPATVPVAVSAVQETAPEASTPVVTTSVQFVVAQQLVAAHVALRGGASESASRSVTETESPLKALALICMLYRSSVPADCCTRPGIDPKAPKCSFAIPPCGTEKSRRAVLQTAEEGAGDAHAVVVGRADVHRQVEEDARAWHQGHHGVRGLLAGVLRRGEKLDLPHSSFCVTQVPEAGQQVLKVKAGFRNLRNAKGRMGKIKLFPTPEYTSKQASDPVVPLVPCAGIFLGPSKSGKTVALISLILEQYKGVFERIYVFSPSVNIDDGWIPVKKYIEQDLGVNTEREQAYWDEWDESALRRIIQQQRKITEASKKLEMKKLYQVLVVMLTRRNSTSRTAPLTRSSSEAVTCRSAPG